MNKLVFYFLTLSFFKIFSFDKNYFSKLLKTNYKKIIFATLASYGIYKYRNKLLALFRKKNEDKNNKTEDIISKSGGKRR